MSGVIPNRGVTHLRVGDELGWVKREKKQQLSEVFRTCPMEIGGQRKYILGSE